MLCIVLSLFSRPSAMRLLSVVILLSIYTLPRRYPCPLFIPCQLYSPPASLHLLLHLHHHLHHLHHHHPSLYTCCRHDYRLSLYLFLDYRACIPRLASDSRVYNWPVLRGCLPFPTSLPAYLPTPMDTSPSCPASSSSSSPSVSPDLSSSADSQSATVCLALVYNATTSLLPYHTVRCTSVDASALHPYALNSIHPPLCIHILACAV